MMHVKKLVIDWVFKTRTKSQTQYENPATKEKRLEKHHHYRIGLLVPSSNTMIEPDFYKNVPSEWSVHTSRMYLESTTVEGESRMLDEFALPAAQNLATANPHVIVFGCTSAGALRGNQYDAELTQRISNETGIPVVSVIKSVRQTLAKHKAKKIVVVTPYIDELNNRIRTSLEEDGVEVLRIKGMGISMNYKIAEVPKEQIIKLSLDSLDGLNPDLLFLSCTNFPAMSALGDLRKLIKIPIITSNQVAVEAAVNKIHELDAQ